MFEFLEPYLSVNDEYKQNVRPVLTIENFINGKFVPSMVNGNGKTLDSYDPSTGETWAKIPDSDSQDVDEAVLAAKEAFKTWSRTTRQYRSNFLRKIADLVEQYSSILARAESKDQGKPVSLAESVDVPRCVMNFRFFASSMLHEINECTVLDQPVHAVNYVDRRPVGVAGLITPWNLPLYLLSFKIAPALACGNTVVAKPSEMTSVTAWILAKIFVEAGLPPGVVNFVFGVGQKVGQTIVTNPYVPLVSFTGSTITGQKIIESSAPYFKKLSLEMGGKNPCIIFDDADFSKCIPTVVRSCFANQGEICLCTSRIFVQKSIYRRFLDPFVSLTKKLTVGAPTDPKTDLGALISSDHLNKVRNFVAEAKKQGANILCGEEHLNLPTEIKDGYYMRPTVITDVHDESKIMQEEIFGPVVCVVPFESDQEVAQRANNVKYGLSASLWSENVSRIHKISQSLQAGTIWCNCWLVRDLNMPFGGTKASGIGREGAKDSLEFYTERKTICIKLE